MVKQKLDIPIKVQDQGSKKTLADLNKGFVRLRADVNRALKPVRSIGSGLGFLKSQIFSLQGAFVGLSVFLAGRGIKSILDQADAVGKLARQTGDSVEDLSALEFAMQAAGFRAEDLRTIMTGLGRSTAAALSGNTLQVDAFTELGIGIDELRSKGAVEILSDMAEGLERLGLADQKRVLKDIFPDNFQRVLPLIGDGVDSFEKLLELARQSGAIISDRDVAAAEDFNDSMLSLRAAATGLFREFATEFAGPAAQQIKGLTAFIRQEDETIRSIFGSLGTFASTAVSGATEILLLGVKAVELFKDTNSSPELEDARGRLQEIESKLFLENSGRIFGVSAARDAQTERIRELEQLRDLTLDEIRLLEVLNPKLSTQLESIKAEVAEQVEKFRLGLATDPALGEAADQIGEVVRELERARRDAEAGGAAGGFDDEASQRTALTLRRDQLQVEREMLSLSTDTANNRAERIRVEEELFRIQTRIRALSEPAVAENLDGLLSAGRQRARGQFRDLFANEQDAARETRIQYLDAKASALSLLEPTEEITREVKRLDTEALKLSLADELRKAGVEAEFIEDVLKQIDLERGKKEGFSDGFFQSFDQLEQRFGTLKGVGSEVGDVLGGAIGGVSDALLSLGEGTEATKRAFKELAISVVRDLGRIAIQSAVVNLIGGGLIASAKGNVFDQGRLIPFARGGIVEQPTFFGLAGNNTGVAGEAGPEGILPLGRMRNGDLGVQFEGAGGGHATQQLNIYMMTPDPQSGFEWLQSQKENIRGMFHDFLTEGGPTRTLFLNGGARG